MIAFPWGCCRSVGGAWAGLAKAVRQGLLSFLTLPPWRWMTVCAHMCVHTGVCGLLPILEWGELNPTSGK